MTTQYYEGYARSRETMRSLKRMAEPTDEQVLRPRSVGYRIGQGLVHLGTHLMRTDEARVEYELAA